MNTRNLVLAAAAALALAAAAPATAALVVVQQTSLTFSPNDITITTGDVPYFCRPHLAMGMTGIVRVQPDPSVGMGNDVAAPGPRLLAAYPNPFNPRTEITFELETAAGARSRTVTLVK
jgi:hypothetical protein